MRKTSFIRLAVAATAVAVMASTTLPAQAAVKVHTRAKQSGGTKMLRR